jgi:hypothetical protein
MNTQSLKIRYGIFALIVMLMSACVPETPGVVPEPDDNDPPQKVCNVDNPLTDLPWLKEIIDGFEKDAGAGYKGHARIYQCNYKNGVGFLLEMCVGCPDAGYWLRSCEGESLCIIGGFAGDRCTEFDVDFENKKLIWEKNYTETTKNSLVGKWVTSDYNSRHNDTIHFTTDMRVEDYFLFAHTTIYPASSYYFTYFLTENTVKITSHQPENEAFSETFDYILSGNSLTIKGFSNPFSLTLEARSDVHFTRIE